MGQKTGKKILVVGGVAGGASFAARMRRLDEDANIIMFEKGSYVSFANCGLPYHIGETIAERDKLIVQTPEGFRSRFNVDVRLNSEVRALDPKRKVLTVQSGERTYEENYDILLLSPGASPLRPNLPGIDSDKVLTLRTLPDMDVIKKQVDDGTARRAVVIGGGFIGLEMAENLRHRGLEVALVELAEQVFLSADMEMAHILHQHLALNGVRLILNTGVRAFVDRGSVLETQLDDGTVLNSEMAILAIGVKPDTEFLASSGIRRNARGGIVVDPQMRTNLPDVYEVGDAIEVVDFATVKPVMVPLAGPANRQGRIAADVVAGRDAAYRSTQGTAVCKIFDLTVAVTGLNEKIAKRDGIPFIKSYTHSLSHAGYYPGAYLMSLKLLFSPDSKKVLGAQIVGSSGVDKRIDVLATAVRHGFTVDELTELELAYAPPYGSAKDPVNMAGFVAQNILEGRTPIIYAEDIAVLDLSKQVLLDVRTEAEAEQGMIENAVLIPVDSLRQRAPKELDKNKEIIIYCQVGLRGHIAVSMLRQMGFRTRNLSGGYKTYKLVTSDDYDSAYLDPLTVASCSSTEGALPAKRLSIDARGLQCPGPIMQLKQGMDTLRDGESLEIQATDSGFSMDVPAWCARTGNTLTHLTHEKGLFTAVVRKGMLHEACPLPTEPNVALAAGFGGSSDQKTMVLFSNDFDRAMASFIIANGAAAMGSQVTIFFTFWGLNLLRKDRAVKVSKTFMERMFGNMMPRGNKKVVLSKMNMGGMGTSLMQKEMKKKNVMSLPELMAEAQKNGVRFIACTMSMDIMGIKKEELIDGIEYGGVAAYLAKADQAGYNIFI